MADRHCRSAKRCVAAGLADYTGFDPTLVRLGFVAATLVTGPVMILLYLIAAWVAPER